MDNDAHLPTSPRSGPPLRHVASPPVEKVRVAEWMIEVANPRVFVHLGKGDDEAYLHFRQMLHRLSPGTRCYAVENRTCPEKGPVDGEGRQEPSFDHSHDNSFSWIQSEGQEWALSSFANGSIDLLHVRERWDDHVAAAALEAWLPKMSESGLVLLDRGVTGGDGANDRFIREFGSRFPTFESADADGLVLIAVGALIPKGLSDRLASGEIVPIRPADGDGDAPSGRGLADRQCSQGGGHHPDASCVDLEVLRAELLRARAATAFMRAERAQLERDLHDQSRKVSALIQENGSLWEARGVLADQLQLVEGSFGWVVIQRLRRVRSRFLRDGTIPGRGWSLFARFVKTALTSGTAAAVRKARNKVARKLRLAAATVPQPAGAVPPPTPSPDVPVDRFRELPWRSLGGRHQDPSRRRGHFPVLLVAHSACRTGAPLCFLRFAEELSKIPDFDCWIVLQKGGELADSFAQFAPTLDIDALMARGVPRDAAFSLIAEAFREYSSRGVAICNTMAVHRFHIAFAERQIPVLSWIHELPTFIEMLGGSAAIEAIKAASRMLIVPAEFVREAWISRFGIEPDRIRTIHYGIEPRSRGLSRQACRREVREELGLPADARIVLGCGTIDLRKGADLFVNLARRVLTDTRAGIPADNTWFVWLGHGADDILRQWLRHDARVDGLEDRILFIGPRPDTAPYFLAADLFAMTSREDPSPLANHEAMESGLAVVAFREAGGAPEVLGDRGVAVPYLDVEAMAVAVAELLADPARRDQLGRRAQELTREHFTWSRFMKEYLEVLAAHYDYHPPQQLRVSVIVPNYRYAEYLEARLGSIFAQTLAPHEIIFLDNASPDNSVEVARRLATLAPVPMKIVVNEVNNNNTFLQWMKGLSLATGDLVWIAEADDYCRPEFLERLVPEFYDPEVVLAYSQSAIVGAQGELLLEAFLGHTDEICRERWRSRHTATGVDEVERFLSWKNTIPNASAVVFRRPPSLDFADELAKFRFAGDWLFYAMQLRSGRIAYAPESLNYHRRHDKTVTRQSILGDTHADETLRVKARIFETFPISAEAIVSSLWQSVMEYNFLTDRLGLKRPAITAHPGLAGSLRRIRAALEARRGASAGLRVLLVIDCGQDGLEGVFHIHLANALSKGHDVYLVSARPQAMASSPIGRVDQRVTLLEGTLGRLPWPPTIESPLEPLAHDDPRRLAILEELIRFHRIDVIHSLSRSADRLVLGLNEGLRFPWFVHVPRGDEDPDGLDARILGSARGFFYQHERDLAIFGRLGIDTPGRLSRLISGPDRVPLVGDVPSTFPDPGEDLRFFVAPAQGHGTRGWDDAVTAVRIVNALPAGARGHRRARLVLLVDRSPADVIRDRLRPDDDVDILPESEIPLAALAGCHVALFPYASTDGEAERWAIAALACDRPVIAADRGAIPEIIADEDREAGTLLPLTGGPSIDPDRLVTAMLAYLKLPEMYAAHIQHARRIFDQRFSVERNAAACIEAYLEVRNLLTFPRREGSTLRDEGETATLQSRRFA